MKKILLGVLIGIVTWFCLFSVSDFIWATVTPSWYGKYRNELTNAVYQNGPFTTQTSILVIVVLRSIIYSIITGLVTAAVAYENYFSTLIAGFLLTICAFLIHLSFWELAPFWFHLLVLFQFIPFTMLGGSLIKLVPKYPKLAF